MKPDEIQALRRTYNETQLVFARRVGCTPQTLHNWESGRTAPDARYLLRLRGILTRQRSQLDHASWIKSVRESTPH